MFYIDCILLSYETANSADLLKRVSVTARLITTARLEIKHFTNRLLKGCLNPHELALRGACRSRYSALLSD